VLGCHSELGPPTVRLSRVVKLTHGDLGKLVGATRQSVSAALSQLGERGTLRRDGDGTWLLPIDVPEEIGDMLGRRPSRSGSPVL
jgi:DNA-binding IclR family transcriptional regulator